MKCFCFLVLVCVGLPFILFAQDEPEFRHRITVEESYQYLPEYLNDVYIGMPLADFENVKDTLELDITDNPADMWFGAIEEVEQDGIAEVIYKFDKEENGVNTERPLYQINIRFSEKDDEDSFVNKFRGSDWDNYSKDTDNPDKEQWVFNTNKDYVLIIKKIDDTVEIIATMAGTEWDPNR